MLILFVWVGITYFGAEYVDSANRQMKQILGVILLCITIANLGKNERLIPYLYIIYVILFIGAWIYAQEHILSVAYDFSQDRLNDDKLNANTIAYYLFFSTSAIYFLGELIRNRYLRWILQIIFISTIFISFFIAILTASRQVLVIQIPLIGLLLLMRYKISGYKSFLAILTILVIVSIVFMDKGRDIYDHSFLKERVEMNAREDSRAFLYKDAIQVGMNSPFWGVGPGNYVHYCPRKEFSHCTYVELFANTGIIGALIYIIMVLKFVKTQWRRYQVLQDKIFLIFFIIGLIFIIDNFFYVFYPNLWLMSFFILIATHSETYFKSRSNACL